ncbi:MAG TPA: hypothetical protein VEQ66_14235 [Propionibacteriaceae bacterium]|nr:hypothetical protein [Propionibacteriaceae bacterium]
MSRDDLSSTTDPVTKRVQLDAQRQLIAVSRDGTPTVPPAQACAGADQPGPPLVPRSPAIDICNEHAPPVPGCRPAPASRDFKSTTSTTFKQAQ